MNKEKTTLYKVKKGSKYTVVSVPEITLLNSIGIRAGLHIRVQSHYFFGGPVLLRVEETYTVALGKQIANQIFVEEMFDELNKVNIV